jgi:hypothetical protein
LKILNIKHGWQGGSCKHEALSSKPQYCQKRKEKASLLSPALSFLCEVWVIWFSLNCNITFLCFQHFVFKFRLLAVWLWYVWVQCSNFLFVLFSCGAEDGT